MTKICLVQSGGIMGRTRKAELDLDLSEEALAKLKSELQAPNNKQARDAFNHVLIIDNERFSFMPEKVSGKTKTIISKLMKSLKV